MLGAHAFGFRYPGVAAHSKCFQPATSQWLLGRHAMKSDAGITVAECPPAAFYEALHRYGAEPETSVIFLHKHTSKLQGQLQASSKVFLSSAPPTTLILVVKRT